MGTPNNISPLQSSTMAGGDPGEMRSALERWTQNYAQLLNILLDAYCVVDTHNQIVSFNVAFAELCGESYRKITKIGDFCSLLHTELCPEHCPAIQTAASGKALRIDELKGSSKAFPELQMILAAIPIFSPMAQRFWAHSSQLET